MRGDIESDDSEDKVIVKRFLTFEPPKPPPRCPFPNEDPDEVPEHCTLFLDEHECCGVCFVCPCFDGTFYDFDGEVITDLCENDYCNYMTPSWNGRFCDENACDERREKRRELTGKCCECTLCTEGKIFVLPQDDERCEPPLPTTTTTTTTTPKTTTTTELPNHETIADMRMDIALAHVPRAKVTASTRATANVPWLPQRLVHARTLVTKSSTRRGEKSRYSNVTRGFVTTLSSLVGQWSTATIVDASLWSVRKWATNVKDRVTRIAMKHVS